MIKKINLIAGGNDLAFATILRRQVGRLLMWQDIMIAIICAGRCDGYQY